MPDGFRAVRGGVVHQGHAGGIHEGPPRLPDGERAGELGPHVEVVVGGLLETNALHRLRAAQGIIGLADRYDAGRVDAACRRAIEVGDPNYRTVKGILAAGTEADESSGPAVTVPAHLHGQAGLFGEGVAS